MSKNTKICLSLSVILALVLGIGIGSYAATTYGTQSDPLVTLSYLTDKHTPEVMAKLDELLVQKNAELEGKISDTLASQDQITSDTYHVVSLDNGQILSGSVGCEIMLRIGTVSCEADKNPGLIDMSSGATLDDGKELTANHMYMVTIAENGIKATSSNVKVLVRGEYTLN